MEMIILLKFEVDKAQLKDQTKETLEGMHILLQEYARNAVDRAIQEDCSTFFKLIESACAKMFPDGKTIRKPSRGIGGPAKMTGGEGK